MRALHAIAILLLPAMAHAQSVVDQATFLGIAERLGSDRGAALRCEAAPIRPALSFGLRLEAGYTFRLPLNQFSGPGHRLTVLTRITSSASAVPVFLIDAIPIPPVPPTDLEGEYGGGFFVGEGRYQVNWMLVDERGRTCRKDWQMDAQARRGGRAVKLLMPPNTVAELSLRRLPLVDRHPDPAAPVRLTVLLDAAPLSGAPATQTTLSSSDQVFLLGALSALLERIPASSVRLVAFNLELQKELFRRDDFTLDSLDEVAGALNQVQLANVDYQTLQSPTGHLALLARLINQELSAPSPSDVVIFLGPRERFIQKLPAGALMQSRRAKPRFFFLSYQKPLEIFPARDGALRAPGSGGRAGRGSGDGLPPLVTNTDMISAQPKGGAANARPNVPRTPAPDTSNHPYDSVSQAITALKGKTIAIETPEDFAKAIGQIERQPH